LFALKLDEIKLRKIATALFKAMIAKLLQVKSVQTNRPKATVEEIRICQNRLQNIEDSYADRKISSELFSKS
jgi:hypothetical protein